jgi:hypothetical protein
VVGGHIGMIGLAAAMRVCRQGDRFIGVWKLIRCG